MNKWLSAIHLEPNLNGVRHGFGGRRGGWVICPRGVVYSWHVWPQTFSGSVVVYLIYELGFGFYLIYFHFNIFIFLSNSACRSNRIIRSDPNPIQSEPNPTGFEAKSKLGLDQIHLNPILSDTHPSCTQQTSSVSSFDWRNRVV